MSQLAVVPAPLGGEDGFVSHPAPTAPVRLVVHRRARTHLAGPRFFALCGHPTSGKSEVQKILEESYGVKPIDDGWPLRDFAIRHLGADLHDVTTQEGKATTVTMPGGHTMTWRKFLGEFGNAIEALLGPDAIPEIAIRSCSGFNDRARAYSFGSVRREQGAVIKRHGGLIAGIRAPWAAPSQHEFDRFNADLVDFWIDNDVRERSALEQKVRAAFGPYLDPNRLDVV